MVLQNIRTIIIGGVLFSFTFFINTSNAEFLNICNIDCRCDFGYTLIEKEITLPNNHTKGYAVSSRNVKRCELAIRDKCNDFARILIGTSTEEGDDVVLKNATRILEIKENTKPEEDSSVFDLELVSFFYAGPYKTVAIFYNPEHRICIDLKLLSVAIAEALGKSSSNK